MDQILAELLKLGPAGLAIGYLLLKNRQLETALGAAYTRIDALQEKRIYEAMETVKTLGANAGANEKMAEAVE